MAFPNDVPESMDELIYFSNRKLPDGQRLIAWTNKKECECGGTFGKPVDEKTGKVKIRSSTYICSGCGKEEPKKEHEESLTLEIRYTNPEGTEWKAASTPYKRKTWKGVKSFVFENEFTGEKQGITKKMKEPKKKKKKK